MYRVEGIVKNFTIGHRVDCSRVTTKEGAEMYKSHYESLGYQGVKIIDEGI